MGLVTRGFPIEGPNGRFPSEGHRTMRFPIAGLRARRFPNAGLVKRGFPIEGPNGRFPNEGHASRRFPIEGLKGRKFPIEGHETMRFPTAGLTIAGLRMVRCVAKARRVRPARRAKFPLCAAAAPLLRQPRDVATARFRRQGDVDQQLPGGGDIEFLVREQHSVGVRACAAFWASG